MKAPVPSTCPACNSEGTNDKDIGGTATCFHCGHCGWIDCIYFDRQRDAALQRFQANLPVSTEQK